MVDVETGFDECRYETDGLLEAPNWSPDGKSLIVNGGGRLFSFDLALASLTAIATGDVGDVNNDHLISPDGATLVISARGTIHTVPVRGGRPTQLIDDPATLYYAHGMAPAGDMVACTTIRRRGGISLWGIDLVPLVGGAPRMLISGWRPVDGPEWTPDGCWLWFNREDPHSNRLYRIRPDGGVPELMTHADGVAWFPHPSPDGRTVAFLTYPAGTRGHPANLPVEIRVMPAQGGAARVVARCNGGQGTLNVNSWSPDSRHLAYVAYPFAP